MASFFDQSRLDNGTVEERRIAREEFDQFLDALPLEERTAAILRRNQNLEERRPKNIDWKNSAARDIIIQDLESGLLSLDRNEMPARMAWDLMYKNMIEFKDVLYTQFRDRLNDHRKVMSAKKIESKRQLDLFNYSKTLHPPKEKNSKGEPIWENHPAQELLRKDVADMKHKEMKPQALQASRHEYQVFDSKVFRDHIYQEIRRNKFMNYLNDKREMEAEAQAERLKNMNLNNNL